MEEISRYKKLYNDMFTERNQLKQQCTQAIRQWDTAIRERNEYKEQYGKVKRQHEEDIKEINQNMIVRVKASKDIKRLTDERNAAMQEYSLIMSERDTFHKEMEKIQDEVSESRKAKKQEEEERKKIELPS
jgi:chromosome segregation ATPase